MKVKYLFLLYFLWCTTAHLAANTDPISDFAATDNTNSCLLIKEQDSNGSKHCEIVELPGIPIPVSHQIKNKYSGRFKQQFISYSKRASSLLDINDHVVTATLNISPLSDILQI
jgi:hypothetical protein